MAQRTAVPAEPGVPAALEAHALTLAAGCCETELKESRNQPCGVLQTQLNCYVKSLKSLFKEELNPAKI